MATLQDIADSVGLSRDTVSRIINRDATYTKPALARRAERVRQVAIELGYRPNAAARAARSGRFGAVALIQPPSPAMRYLPTTLLMSLVRELATQQTHLIVSEISAAALTGEGRLPHTLRELASDGLFINHISDIPPAAERFVGASGSPAIWLNSDQPADCVRPDDAEAVRLAGQALLDQGHRRLALLFSLERPEAVHYSRPHREAAFTALAREAGLHARIGGVRKRWDEEPAASFQRLRAQLRATDRPTGLLVTSAASALSVVMAARDEGLRIPHDLSLVCVGEAGPDGLEVAIASAAHDWQRLGEIAAGMIRAKIENPRQRQDAVAVLPKFVQGGSIVPPPTS